MQLTTIPRNLLMSTILSEPQKVFLGALWGAQRMEHTPEGFLFQTEFIDYRKLYRCRNDLTVNTMFQLLTELKHFGILTSKRKKDKQSGTFVISYGVKEHLLFHSDEEYLLWFACQSKVNQNTLLKKIRKLKRVIRNGR